MRMHPIMNDTRWNERRLAMDALGDLRPTWRTRDVSGHLSAWDGEWCHQFREGGCGSIEWVEIRVNSPDQDAAVLASLREIHVPGHRVEQGFRVYGYAWDGISLGYI